jgi:F420-non-reducing hydrogenase large subunit
MLRDALNLGSIIHSHGVHFFALAGPDLLLGLDADPAERNIVGLVKAVPDVATKALRLRSIGQRVTEIIGGRGTHPVSFVPGGVAAPLTAEKRAALQKLTDEGVPLGQELYAVAKKALIDQLELATSLPQETHYLGTVNDGALDLYQGELRLLAPDGSHFDFSEDDWSAHLIEQAVPTSYAKPVVCKKPDGSEVTYRVGPLARLNCADYIDTPIANAELEEFRKVGGSPCHQTVFYHWARLIELVHAVEKLAVLVADDEIVSEDVLTPPSGTPHRATAHIEAPRGTLIHDYDVDSEGIVTKANLVVATQQNLAGINEAVGMSAQRYLDQPDELMLNAVEFGIRCYDPCLSCATHRLGDMKLDVVVRSGGKTIRRVRR